MKFENEFRELVRRSWQRPGGDYGELIWKHRVSALPVDPIAWRRNILEQARQDGLPVQAWIYSDGRVEAAVIFDAIPPMLAAHSALRSRAYETAFSLAGHLGHRIRLVCSEYDAIAAVCVACGARLFIKLWHSEGLLDVDGEAVTGSCVARHR